MTRDEFVTAIHHLAKRAISQVQFDSLPIYARALIHQFLPNLDQMFTKDSIAGLVTEELWQEIQGVIANEHHPESGQP